MIFKNDRACEDFASTPPKAAGGCGEASVERGQTAGDTNTNTLRQ